MSEPKITKCGLHMVGSDAETDASFDAKMALSQRLAEVSQTSWDQFVWFGYLSAMLDLEVELNPDGIRPTFVALWELASGFRQDDGFFDDVLDALTHRSLTAAAEIGVGRIVSGNKDENRAAYYTDGEFDEEKFDALCRPHELALAAKLRAAADLIERGEINYAV